MGSSHADHERGAAPVLLLYCSDHRMSRSSDVAVIEKLVDVLAFEHGLVQMGEKVEFDGLRVPGPQKGLAEGSETEIEVLLSYCDTLLNLHGGELVIVAFHTQCGREGEYGTDTAHMTGNLRRSIARLRERFPGQMFAGMMIGLWNGRTQWAETVHVEESTQSVSFVDHVVL